MLQFVGSAIRFGPFSISLVLIPIVLGAALYGWGMGCWLGLVFGAVVLLSGDAGLFLAADPGGAIVTVLSKGIACGAAAGRTVWRGVCTVGAAGAKRLTVGRSAPAEPTGLPLTKGSFTPCGAGAVSRNSCAVMVW